MGKKTHTVRAPIVIMESNESVKRAFVRGYFDADGSLGFQKRSYNEEYCEAKKIYHYYPRIYIESASRDLINDIENMLDSLGFRCKVYRRTRCSGKYSAYAIVIKGATQIDKWMNDIKSSNPVHISKYLVWKKYGFCPPRLALDQRLAILEGKISPKFFYNGGERAQG